MSNTTLTADIVLKEASRVFRNNCPFVMSMNRQYDGSYAAHGAKEGSDIRIKTPQRYTVRTGKTIDVQDNIENSVTLSRATQLGVDLKFSSAELTQDITRLSELYIKPAAITLASEVEFQAQTTAYQSAFNTVTLPTGSLDKDDILSAGVLLDDMSTPRDAQRCVILDPQGQADVVSNLSGLFQASDKIRDQYNSGTMGTALGYNFKMSQNVNSHTTGTFTTGSTPLTAGAATEGASTIATDGWAVTTDIFTKGDVITIAGINGVNRVTGKSTGKLQQFVITADTSSDGAGLATLPISPSLTSVGADKTIDALPGDGIVITPFGTEDTAYTQNLSYHPSSFAFATVDLDMPADVGFKARTVEDNVSMRIVSKYDINNDDTYYRLDILKGEVAVVPEWLSRVYGGPNI